MMKKQIDAALLESLGGPRDDLAEKLEEIVQTAVIDAVNITHKHNCAHLNCGQNINIQHMDELVEHVIQEMGDDDGS